VKGVVSEQLLNNFSCSQYTHTLQLETQQAMLQWQHKIKRTPFCKNKIAIGQKGRSGGAKSYKIPIF